MHDGPLLADQIYQAQCKASASEDSCDETNLSIYCLLSLLMKKDKCCFVLASLVLLLYQAKVGYSGYTFPSWKVVADVRPFCLEVPSGVEAKRCSHRAGHLWSEGAICKCFHYSLSTIHLNPFDLKYPCVSNRSPGTKSVVGLWSRAKSWCFYHRLWEFNPAKVGSSIVCPQKCSVKVWIPLWARGNK